MTTVLHLLKGLGPGGAERLVVAQACATGTVGHRVAYLVPEKYHLVAALDRGGIAVTCLDATSAARPRWVRRLRRLLRDEPVDILHVHSPALAAVARILVRTVPSNMRPVVISTEHNRWPRHHRLTRFANRATIRLQARTIAVSDDVKSTVRGIGTDEVDVVVHGIELAAVRATADRGGARSELGVQPDDVVVVCVANLRREKALDVLVDAAAQALSTEPRLRYFLVGQGPLSDEVDRWISEAGIAERFTALGYRADATRVLSAADVFTLSSAHEGLPVAIMEALALGIPVVATAAGGVPMAVGTGGSIVPIGDAAALAQGYVALAADVAERRRLATAALHEARRFELGRAVEEIESIYAAAIAGRGARDNSQS